MAFAKQTIAACRLASHAGVFRGARFSCGKGWKTSSPKNACVGGYMQAYFFLPSPSLSPILKRQLLPWSHFLARPNTRSVESLTRSQSKVRLLCRLAAKFDGPSFFFSLNISLGIRQWRHVALRHEASCVSRQHGLCRRFHISWRADVFMHRLWNNVYDRWITSNLTCKWHRTASTTSGWKSSPAKIFHCKSSGERRLKFIFYFVLRLVTVGLTALQFIGPPVTLLNHNPHMFSVHFYL